MKLKRNIIFYLSESRTYSKDVVRERKSKRECETSGEGYIMFLFFVLICSLCLFDKTILLWNKSGFKFEFL